MSDNVQSNDSRNSKNNKNNGIDHQLQMVMDLMEQRTQGQASNAQVQEAVSRVLSGMVGTPPPRTTMVTTSAAPISTCTANDTRIPDETQNNKDHVRKRPLPPTTPVIQADTEDYDDDDDGVEDKKIKVQPVVKTKRTRISTTHSASTKNEHKGDDHDDNDDDVGEPDWDDNSTFDEEEYLDQISLVPLGKQGAQMMTTFGDGRRPRSESVSAALMGTRHCLQVAIWDARALRRATKQTFAQAQRVKRGESKGINSYGIDPNMLFRAMSGHDKLAYDPKCGFDMEQLRTLFPEEIRAYTRWKDMRNQAEENAVEDQEGGKGNESNDGKSGGDTAKENHDDAEGSPEDSDLTVGGHLQERAAQFDLRTERMKKELYLKFAKVRQGSFLPRGKRHRKSESEAQWDKKSSKKTTSSFRKGRTVAGIWESMSAASVQFLHWLGFDPPMLPPPNDETTQALAFLGYDFLGKIVEKAIFLRNSKQLSETERESDIMMELKRGEQLTPEDIDTALKHSDIRPVPLFGVDKKSQPPVGQLYFGPGFEERLELEMDELIAAGTEKGLSEDEVRIREEEAALFAKLAKPPTVTDSVNYLMEQDNEADEAKGADLGNNIDIVTTETNEAS